MRILVVDDDPTALALIEAALSLYGFTSVKTAISAAEAMTMLQRSSQPFDCFLLDYRMPGVDGAELSSQIRRLRQYKSTPIIFVTAASDRSSINTAYSVGAVDYISKPIDPQEIGIRVSIAEKLLLEERARSGSDTALTPMSQHRGVMPPFDIADPVPLFHVEGAISRHALENYIKAIAQTAPDDFAISAIAIREFEEIHAEVSPSSAYVVISQIAKVISDSLRRNQSLITYNGYGEFICVTKNVDLTENDGQARRINSRISRLNFILDEDKPVTATVAIGKPAQSRFRSGDDPMLLIQEALSSPDNSTYTFRSPAMQDDSLASCTSPIVNL